MTQGRRLHRLTDLLESHSLNHLGDYLPSPDYVKRVIVLTNAGKIDKALAIVDKTAHILDVLSTDLDLDDREWYSETIQMLRQAILAAQEKN